MERKPVQSSQIAAIGYDPKTEVLEIEFQHKGAVYQYAGVPLDTANELLRAGSVGKYFNENIKGKYNFVKL